ncbi:MAG TPA: glycosyltransferase [Candidatus Baltobacteraceae bacterium]
MLRIGVDAINLIADRRGMGRYARAILRDLAAREDVETTLLFREREQEQPLRDEFSLETASVRDADSRRFDAIWYPWNGIRFEPAAPKLVTIHDAFAFTDPAPGFIARFREQAPIKRAFRVADAFASVSNWSAAQIARASGVDVARFTIASPVPDAFWQPVEPALPRHPYVLFVAGPDERKNAALLFAAFERAFPDGDLGLLVAGSLRASDEAALRDSNVVHERVRPNDEALREFYCGAYAVAIPSLAEGYGLMAVEAMACGAPVLAADAAALPEACDGAAVLLPPNDRDAWSAALRTIAEDDALRRDLRARSLARAARIDRAAPASITLELLQRLRAGVR